MVFLFYLACPTVKMPLKEIQLECSEKGLNLSVCGFWIKGRVMDQGNVFLKEVGAEVWYRGSWVLGTELSSSIRAVPDVLF